MPAWGLEEPECLQGLVENHIHHAEKALVTTPVLLPGEPQRRGSLVGCSPWVAKSRTQLNNFTFTFHFHALEKARRPTPVFLPGESQGRGSLVGCCLWGRTELDTTEAIWQQQGELRSPKPCYTAKKQNKDRSRFFQNKLTKLTTA